MKQHLLFLASLFFIVNTAWSQMGCNPNIGFELGTTAGWQCLSGTYGSGPCPPTGACPSFNYNFTDSVCLDSLGIDCPLYDAADRHCVIDGLYIDSNSLFYIGLPPGSGNYAFRLGNGIGGGTNTNPNYAQAEGISFTYLVDTNNAGFTYRYVAFLQDTFHADESGPRFEVVVTAHHTIIPCGSYKVVAGTTNANCGNIGNYYHGRGLWYDGDWTTVALDFSSYIGDTVSVLFRTADCFEKDTGTCNYHPGPHSAYAYIDAFCSPSPLAGYQPTFISMSHCTSPDTMCGPAGFFSYLWSPGGETTQCIIVNPGTTTTYTLDIGSFTGCQSEVSITLLCNVGVNELKNENVLSVFPNPASSAISIAQSLSKNEVVTVSIINVLGEVIKTETVNLQKDFNIDIQSLVEGIYFIKLKNKEREWIGKFVKQ